MIFSQEMRVYGLFISLLGLLVVILLGMIVGLISYWVTHCRNESVIHV